MQGGYCDNHDNELHYCDILLYGPSPWLCCHDTYDSKASFSVSIPYFIATQVKLSWLKYI